MLGSRGLGRLVVIVPCALAAVASVAGVTPAMAAEDPPQPPFAAFAPAPNPGNLTPPDARTIADAQQR
ncbi:MAG: hypothetical protein QG597_2574, partial [Actinomycetota bacterium]|nr:hypothetical protein [Actinomycetota bacterium]